MNIAEIYKILFLNILDAVDYTGDKDIFVEQFLNGITVQSLSDLIETLPSGEQSKIKQELTSAAESVEKQKEIIDSHFTDDQKLKALEEAANKGVTAYLVSINDQLSPTQRENLVAAIQKLDAATEQV